MPSSASYWRRVWRHFKRNTLAVVGLWIALTLILMAVLFSGLMTLLFKTRDWMLKWQIGIIKW